MGNCPQIERPCWSVDHCFDGKDGPGSSGTSINRLNVTTMKLIVKAAGLSGA